jgi:hypothetical protein
MRILKVTEKHREKFYDTLNVLKDMQLHVGKQE